MLNSNVTQQQQHRSVPQNPVPNQAMQIGNQTINIQQISQPQQQQQQQVFQKLDFI